MSSLINASRQGDAGKVAELLTQGIWVDHQEQGGKSPLLVAAFQGHVDVITALLEYQAEVLQWCSCPHTNIESAQLMQTFTG